MSSDSQNTVIYILPESSLEANEEEEIIVLFHIIVNVGVEGSGAA